MEHFNVILIGAARRWSTRPLRPEARRTIMIAGQPGWGWNSLLPYFIPIETDHDFGDQPINGSRKPSESNDRPIRKSDCLRRRR